MFFIRLIPAVCSNGILQILLCISCIWSKECTTVPDEAWKVSSEFFCSYSMTLTTYIANKLIGGIWMWINLWNSCPLIRVTFRAHQTIWRMRKIHIKYNRPGSAFASMVQAEKPIWIWCVPSWGFSLNFLAYKSWFNQFSQPAAHSMAMWSSGTRLTFFRYIIQANWIFCLI